MPVHEVAVPASDPIVVPALTDSGCLYLFNAQRTYQLSSAWVEEATGLAQTERSEGALTRHLSQIKRVSVARESLESTLVVPPPPNVSIRPLPVSKIVGTGVLATMLRTSNTLCEFESTGPILSVSDTADMVGLARTSASADHASVLSIYQLRSRLCMGPRFMHGNLLTPLDLYIRAGSTIKHPEPYSALVNAHVTHPRLVAAQSPFSSWSSSVLEFVLHALISSYTAWNPDDPRAVVAISLPDCTATRHMVREVPGLEHNGRTDGDPVLRELWSMRQPARCANSQANQCSLSRRPKGKEVRISDVLDPLFGPFTGILETEAEPDEPPSLATATVRVAELGRYLTWSPDQAGAGVGFEANLVRSAAAGEAAERYSGQIGNAPYIIADLNHLETDVGLDAVRPPSDWDYFVNHQYQSPDFPFSQPGRSEPLAWTKVQSVDGHETAWVPTDRVLLNARRVTGIRNWTVAPLAGIAAGRNLEHALEAGMLELIERDATMAWWHGGSTAVEHVVGRSTSLPGVRSSADGVNVRLLCLDHETGVPVFAAVLTDAHHQLLTIGFAARRDALQAAAKATAEAWQSRRLCLALLDSNSWIWTGVKNGRLRWPVTSYRSDRCYLESFRHDFSDITQLPLQLLYYLDPDAHGSALQIIDRSVRAEKGLADPAHRAQDILDRPTRVAIVDAGWRLYYTDLTTPDIQELGLTVARVLSPDACPNTAAAYVPLGHRRLREANSDRLNLIPLPHA